MGNLTKVSAPPSANSNIRNDTTFTHFDNGWIHTSTDPWDIVTSYDYNPLGKQITRTLTSAGGSSDRAISWDYFTGGNPISRIEIDGHCWDYDCDPAAWATRQPVTPRKAIRPHPFCRTEPHW